MEEDILTVAKVGDGDNDDDVMRVVCLGRLRKGVVLQPLRRSDDAGRNKPGNPSFDMPRARDL